MSYAIFYDVPGDEHVYARVKAEIGGEPAKGLLVQLVVKADAGGVRHFQVWESRRDWERFQAERVEPAVGTVLAGMGMTGPRPPAPPPQEMELIDLITPA